MTKTLHKTHPLFLAGERLLVEMTGEDTKTRFRKGRDVEKETKA